MSKEFKQLKSLIERSMKEKKGEKKKKQKRKKKDGSGSVTGGFSQALTAPVSTTQNFTFSGQKKASKRVEREIEPVMDLTAYKNYTVNDSLILNPGNSVTFPRLSKIAAEYQEYKFEELEFIYIPESTTQEDGYVILSPAYNPDQPVPATKQAAQTNWNAATGAKWTKSVSVLAPEMMFPLGPRKYVDLSTAGIGERQTKDVGRLDVCTGNAPAETEGKVWGQLFVKYKCILYAPVIQTVTRPPSLYSSAVLSNAGSGTVYTTGIETPIVWQAFSQSGSNATPNALGLTFVNDNTVATGNIGFTSSDSALTVLLMFSFSFRELSTVATAETQGGTLRVRYRNSANLGPLPPGTNAVSGDLAFAGVQLQTSMSVTASTPAVQITGVARLSLEKMDQFFITIAPNFSTLGVGEQCYITNGDLVVLSIG